MIPIEPSRSLRRVAVIALAASLGLLALPGLAQDKPTTPTNLPGGHVASAEEAKKLFDKKTALFVDTRNVVNFGKGHVPSAQAMPYKGSSDDAANFDASKDQFDLSKLPANKDQPLVFYSDGPTGWKSYKAAVLAVKAGHKSVHYMRGGWAEWSSKGLPAE